MDAKKRLGREIVEIYHGADAATAAQGAFEQQFEKKDVPDEMPEIEIEVRAKSARLICSSRAFGGSKSEARRMVEQGAVAVDGDKVEDATMPTLRSARRA